MVIRVGDRLSRHRKQSADGCNRNRTDQARAIYKQTLKFRTLRNCYSKHLGLGCDLRCHLAAAPEFWSLAVTLRLGSLLDATRFDRRAALQPPFSRAISSRCAATMILNSDTTPSSSTNRASSSARDRSDGSAGGDMPRPNRTRPRRSGRNNQRYSQVMPRLLRTILLFFIMVRHLTQ